MKQYLLSVHSVEGSPPPPPEAIQEAYTDVAAFNDELQSAGAWVFAGGLHPPGTATVVRVQDAPVEVRPFQEENRGLTSGAGRRAGR